MREMKLVKREIIIDEKWPVFTVEEPKKDGPFVVELNDEFYKEYLYFMYKYHEYQIRLQLIYEHQQRIYTESCGYRFPEGSDIHEYTPNKIGNDASKASLRTFLHENS